MANTKGYTTIARTQQAQIVIEKSRFVAAATPVETVEQAVEFVNQRRKMFFDATHNCYAYLIGEKAKYSDDGEPQGTAGLPILECVKNSGLDRVCVVVTRYFGGVKLGAGGLVRAYSGSCAEALKQCEKVQMTLCNKLQLEIDYALLKPLRKALAGKAVELSVQYDSKVQLVFLFSADLYDTILDIVTQTTLGKAKILQNEQLLSHICL